MSIKITNPAQCSGCTACENICGHQAISMKEDEKGFVYPHVDADKCVECELCERVCPYNSLNFRLFCSDNADRKANYL